MVRFKQILSFLPEFLGNSVLAFGVLVLSGAVSTALAFSGVVPFETAVMITASALVLVLSLAFWEFFAGYVRAAFPLAATVAFLQFAQAFGIGPAKMFPGVVGAVTVAMLALLGVSWLVGSYFVCARLRLRIGSDATMSDTEERTSERNAGGGEVLS